MEQYTSDPEQYNFLVSQIDKRETEIDEQIRQMTTLGKHLFENKVFKCFHGSKKGFLVKVRNICMRGRSIYCAVENLKTKNLQVVWWRELRYPEYELKSKNLPQSFTDLLIKLKNREG